MTNFARRQEVGRAEALIEEVARATDKATGFHGWLWKIRMGQVRAEIALAKRDWEETLRWSAVAIKESRLRGRVKYRVLGLGTRAEALRALGRAREAIADLRSAVALARPVGDPTLFLRAATGLLAVDGDDALAAEATTTAERIARALPDARTRGCFEAAAQLFHSNDMDYRNALRRQQPRTLRRPLMAPCWFAWRRWDRARRSTTSMELTKPWQ